MKILAPENLFLNDILPEKAALLMGAGPVPIPLEVAMANMRVVSHLGDSMKQIVNRIQLMGQYVFQTTSKKIFGIAGPSSAAMEMAVTSLVWPGRKVLVLNLGTFSARFSELSKGVGGLVTEIKPNGLSPIRAEDVKAAFEKNHYDVLTVVQGETSCGVKNTELVEILKIAKNYGAQTIVDAVCTLSTMEFLMDEWRIDIAVVGGQKGLSTIPGISMIAFSENTFEGITRRVVDMPHWCLDPRRAHKFWGLGEYHYTAPVPGVLALHEGLRLICAETLEKRFDRHLACSLTLQHCLEVMGLELYAPDDFRLNSVVAIKNPQKVNTKELISFMIKQFQVEISGAFGLDIVRVGQMGEQCRFENIKKVLMSLGTGYEALGVKLDLASALNKFDSLCEQHSPIPQVHLHD